MPRSAPEPPRAGWSARALHRPAGRRRRQLQSCSPSSSQWGGRRGHQPHRHQPGAPSPRDGQPGPGRRVTSGPVLPLRDSQALVLEVSWLSSHRPANLRLWEGVGHRPLLRAQRPRVCRAPAGLGGPAFSLPPRTSVPWPPRGPWAFGAARREGLALGLGSAVSATVRSTPPSKLAGQGAGAGSGQATEHRRRTGGGMASPRLPGALGWGDIPILKAGQMSRTGLPAERMARLQDRA